MLGQSDMLGGGPVDELPSHDGDDGDARTTISASPVNRTNTRIRTSSTEPRDPGGSRRPAG